MAVATSKADKGQQVQVPAGEQKELLKVALVGNPNAGKTSLFNQLTGLNQKVGNFPGVTVDKKTGVSQLSPRMRAKIIDLPGTYSLYPKSLDEAVISNLLHNPQAPLYPDVVVVTVDASNLKRNLLLFTQLADLGLPLVLALNMVDVARQEGVELNLKQLQRDLGVPVVPINARRGEGIADLKKALAEQAAQTRPTFFEIPHELAPVVQEIQAHFQLPNPYLALHYAHQYDKLSFLPAADKRWVEGLLQKHDFDANTQQAGETVERYRLIGELLLNAVSVTRADKDEKFSNRLDRVLTHRVWGYLIFLTVLFLIFQAIFAWAIYPMDLIDEGIAALNTWIQRRLDGPLINLLTEGIIAGLGGILVFIPQIALLFAFIAILEETGYMARVTFMMDKIMRKFGLNGKSVVPLMSGVACAVPAIMSARNIENWKERMITIFVTPLMSCSARIPVYTILIALVVPERYYLGFFNLQGIVLMGLYLLGFVSAILSAWVMKLILKARERSYFIMEFPVYRMPRWKNVGLTIVEKVKVFVWEAGKVIMAISIILWVLASYGPGEGMERAEERAQVTAQQQGLSEQETSVLVSSQQLEASYAGRFGHFIEPAIRPLGFDWKIGIALLTSFAAREVFVGTISTIYSVGEEENVSTIREKLATAVDAEGQVFFTPARALSLLIFYVFAMQCMSTLAIVYRETKSWKWPMAQLIYMTGLAYAASFVVYQLMA
ncbi:ferrous iron transport protein B [soil metagenome]